MQHLCRHVLRNQHKLMRFLQQQVRLCSSRSARPQQKFNEDGEPVKFIQIPPSAYDTKTEPITHDPDNGILFKVNSPDRWTRTPLIHTKLLLLFEYSSMKIGFRFACTTCRTVPTTTETGSRYTCIWKTLHRSHVENILAQKSWWLAEARNYANGKLSHSPCRQSTSLRCRGTHTKYICLLLSCDCYCCCCCSSSERV